MSKIVCTNVYTIPDTSWYKPVNVKNSPRERDEHAQRRKKLGWLPKRIRRHPKMQRILGKPKKTKRKKASRKARRLKTRGDRFNQIVEQAYKSGKI